MMTDNSLKDKAMLIQERIKKHNEITKEQEELKKEQEEQIKKKEFNASYLSDYVNFADVFATSIDVNFGEHTSFFESLLSFEKFNRKLELNKIVIYSLREYRNAIRILIESKERVEKKTLLFPRKVPIFQIRIESDVSIILGNPNNPFKSHEAEISIYIKADNDKNWRDLRDLEAISYINLIEQELEDFLDIKLHK